MAYRGRRGGSAGCGALRASSRVSAAARRVEAVTSSVPTYGGLPIAGEQHATIGVWGAFDTDAFGAQLRMRVVVSELRRRLPHVDVRLFAPFEAGRPYHAMCGEPVESLARFDDSSRRDLADAIDLVVVSVDSTDIRDERRARLLLRGLGSTTRLAWHALGVPEAGGDWVRSVSENVTIDHMSFLDDGAAARWAAAGGAARGAEVPHPALLAPRLFSSDLLAARRQFLHAVDAWPRSGAPLVVQGSGDDIVSIGRLAVTSFESPLVALVADPDAGDARFADAIVERFIDGRRLPDFASVEDRVAAIASAAGVVAASPAVCATAAAFGVPCAPLAALEHRPAEAPLTNLFAASASVDNAVAMLDDDLDAIAALAPDGAEPTAWSEVAALRAALDARGHRLASERAAMADAVAAERARVEPLEQQIAELREAYQDVRNLEVVRWRVALGGVRARFRSRGKQ